MATKGKQKAWRLAALQFNYVRRKVGAGPKARQVKAEASIVGSKNRQELAWQSGEQPAKYVASGYTQPRRHTASTVLYSLEDIIAAEATAIGESMDLA